MITIGLPHPGYMYLIDTACKSSGIGININHVFSNAGNQQSNKYETRKQIFNRLSTYLKSRPPYTNQGSGKSYTNQQSYKPDTGQQNGLSTQQSKKSIGLQNGSPIQLSYAQNKGLQSDSKSTYVPLASQNRMAMSRSHQKGIY